MFSSRSLVSQRLGLIIVLGVYVCVCERLWGQVCERLGAGVRAWGGGSPIHLPFLCFQFMRVHVRGWKEFRLDCREHLHVPAL